MQLLLPLPCGARKLVEEMKSYVNNIDSIRMWVGIRKDATNKELYIHKRGSERFSLGASRRHFFPLDHCNYAPIYIWRIISFQLNTVWWDCQTKDHVPSAIHAAPISLSPGALKPEDAEWLTQIHFSGSPARCSMTCYTASQRCSCLCPLRTTAAPWFCRVPNTCPINSFSA